MSPRCPQAGGHLTLPGPAQLNATGVTGPRGVCEGVLTPRSLKRPAPVQADVHRVGVAERCSVNSDRQDEGHYREDLRPEDDVVHVLATEFVGDERRPGSDRAVHTRGVLPWPLSPAKHRIELPAEHLRRRDLVWVPPD